MADIKTKREFIYLLDGKYYHIGQNACKEVTDPELIHLFMSYYFATHVREFEEVEIPWLTQYAREKVEKAYKELDKRCYVSHDDYIPLDDYSINLRDYLVEKYSEEIDKQVALWTKAREC